MAAPPLPLELVTRAVEEFKKWKSTTLSAKALGISRNKMEHRLRLAEGMGLLDRTAIQQDARLEREFTAKPTQELSPVNKELEDLKGKTEALERDNKVMRSRLKSAEEKLAYGLRLRELVFDLKGDPVPVEWAVSAPTTHSETHSCPILFFSDPQWGEVISAREMDGTNIFNLEIARERYRLMIDKTINIARDHMGVHMNYPGIYYLRGGDMISGNIHAELRETNSLLAIPATKDLFNEEVEGIKKLSDFFGQVHVATVAGNHGRDTFKPQAKGFADSNYDTMGAWMLETYFKQEGNPYASRVSFETATSPDIQFDIYNTKFLLTHGDRIGSRGGQGFIGAIATIVRGQKRVIEEYTAYGINIDHVLTGHFHEPCESIYGWGNGCLPGYSEYAKSGRMGRPSRPSQWLLFVHPKHGVTSRWQLYLGPRPTLSWKHNTGPV